MGKIRVQIMGNFHLQLTLDKWVDPSNVVSGATAGVITEDELKQTVRKLWEQGLPTVQN
jgi:hypothetical protein